MPEWIANVYRQRIFSMCIADVGELRRNGIKRFIPGDFLPAIGGFFHGVAQALGIFVDVIEGL